MASSLHGDVYDTLFTPHVLQEDKRHANNWNLLSSPLLDSHAFVLVA